MRVTLSMAPTPMYIYIDSSPTVLSKPTVFADSHPYFHPLICLFRKTPVHHHHPPTPSPPIQVNPSPPTADTSNNTPTPTPLPPLSAPQKSYSTSQVLDPAKQFPPATQQSEIKGQDNIEQGVPQCQQISSPPTKNQQVPRLSSMRFESQQLEREERLWTITTRKSSSSLDLDQNTTRQNREGEE